MNTFQRIEELNYRIPNQTEQNWSSTTTTTPSSFMNIHFAKGKTNGYTYYLFWRQQRHTCTFHYNVWTCIVKNPFANKNKQTAEMNIVNKIVCCQWPDLSDFFLWAFHETSFPNIKHILKIEIIPAVGHPKFKFDTFAIRNLCLMYCRQ